ncbi:hypothetical protein ABID00_003959 [Faecalicatena orotica]
MKQKAFPADAYCGVSGRCRDVTATGASFVCEPD